MTRSVSVRPVLEHTSPESVVEYVEQGYQWCISSAHAGVIEDREIDWLNPAEDRTSVLVKRNSHRCVWRVNAGARSYFAKLYHPVDLLSKAKLLLRGPTAAREWDVGRYAAAHSIATVLPVATALKGLRGTKGPSLLITEAVPDVEPLNNHWLRIRDDRHRANLLIDSLARLIARAHQCGFQHGDMHPGNILIRQVGRRGEALFVDLHNVRIGRAVSFREVVINLAQLNQWFRRHSTRSQRRRFLDRYLSYRDRFAQASPFARNHRFDPKKLITELALRAERHANRLWAKRDRRTRRSGRYFTRIAPAPGWRGFALLRSKHPASTARAALGTFDREHWQEWLTEPLAWVDPERHDLIKDSHTATVCRALLPTSPDPVAVLVKRPLARSFWKRLCRPFGSSRNMRAWRTANMLLNRDLPTAQPLAVVQRYVFGVIRVDSIGLTDFIPGAVDLETFLTVNVAALAPRQQRRVKDRLILSVVRLVKPFHDRGFAHRDLKAPNLLVNWTLPYEDRPKLTLIDMDGIRHVGRPNVKQRDRALVRLSVSLMGSPACTRTDRLRFLSAYLTGPGRMPTDWKRHWRRLDALLRCKMRDKEVRRVWKLQHYGRE